jgi:hypothetical protein
MGRMCQLWNLMTRYSLQWATLTRHLRGMNCPRDQTQRTTLILHLPVSAFPGRQIQILYPRSDHPAMPLTRARGMRHVLNTWRREFVPVAIWRSHWRGVWRSCKGRELGEIGTRGSHLEKGRLEYRSVLCGCNRDEEDDCACDDHQRACGKAAERRNDNADCRRNHPEGS